MHIIQQIFFFQTLWKYQHTACLVSSDFRHNPAHTEMSKDSQEFKS